MKRHPVHPWIGLAGGAVLVAAFFVPWISISPGLGFDKGREFTGAQIGDLGRELHDRYTEAAELEEKAREIGESVEGRGRPGARIRERVAGSEKVQEARGTLEGLPDPAEIDLYVQLGTFYAYLVPAVGVLALAYSILAARKGYAAVPAGAASLLSALVAFGAAWISWFAGTDDWPEALPLGHGACFALLGASLLAIGSALAAFRPVRRGLLIFEIAVVLASVGGFLYLSG